MRSTLDPLQGRRRSKVLVARNRLQRSTFRPLARSARGTIVQSLSDDADALMDCPNEKDLQMQAFLKAAEGIRTLDLLHGKQLLLAPQGGLFPLWERLRGESSGETRLRDSPRLPGVAGLNLD